MHGLVHAEPLSVGPVQHPALLAGELLRVVEGLEGDVLRFRGGVHPAQDIAQGYAHPGDHHGPGLDAAQAVDPLFQGMGPQQVFQRDQARLGDLALHGDGPGLGAQSVGVARGVILVGSHLVEVVVGGGVLARGLGLVGAKTFGGGHDVGQRPGAGRGARFRGLGGRVAATGDEPGQARQHGGPGPGGEKISAAQVEALVGHLALRKLADLAHAD